MAEEFQNFYDSRSLQLAAFMDYGNSHESVNHESFFEICRPPEISVEIWRYSLSKSNYIDSLNLKSLESFNEIFKL